MLVHECFKKTVNTSSLQHCAYFIGCIFTNKGNAMDASRGIMSGTMDRFKMVK